ncbi:MAG: hypothetical protein IT372_09140 [Polyangiaceae bacterium]|nr:hypothetical protein [Polyangiaceae bacterium]
MSYEITFRFPWSTIERPRVDRAVRAALRDFPGAEIEPDEVEEEPGALNVGELAYTLSLPADLVERHRDEYDDPLPPADEGRYYGSFVIQSDEEAGAYLMLPGDQNGHVWGLMSEIVASIAERLGGRLEQDEEDEEGEGDEEGGVEGDEEDEGEEASLSSWEALADHARATYALDGEGEDWFATTVSWIDTPRTHQVRVTCFEREEGEPWVVLRSAVCKREQLSPEEALRRNDELPVATLALSGDVYELVYSFPMEALTAARFELLLDQLAADADDLEELFSGSDDF